MKLRWLLGNYAEPRDGLGIRKQFEVTKLAHKRYLSRTVLVIWTLVGVLLPVLLLYKFGLPLVFDWLGMTGQTRPFVVGAVVIVVLSWIWAAWVYQFAYVKPVRRAMREYGIDVCVGCGYDLQGHDAANSSCPECGASREP